MSGERPSREVVHGDALDWLRAHPQDPGCSLVTSLPDKAELGLPPERWRPFFVDAARLCLQATPAEGLTIFFQTDNREGGGWVSKAGLVLAAAAAEEHPLLWHKIVCRRPPGTRSSGRPTFSSGSVNPASVSVARGRTRRGRTTPGSAEAVISTISRAPTPITPPTR